MPVIYAESSDGWISSGGSHSSWSSARDASAGNTVDTNDNFTQLGAGVVYTAVKGGSGSFEVVRAFFRFDFSSVSGIVDSGATLSIRGYTSSGSPKARICKSTAFTGGSNTLVVGDFDLAQFAADYATNNPRTWNASGWNDFTLNSDAIDDINNNGELIVALIEHVYDYYDFDPSTTSGGTYAGGLIPAYSDKKIGITWRDRGTATAPHIDYTIAAGYGNHVNTIAPTKQAFVNAVAGANIEEINDV